MVVYGLENVLINLKFNLSYMLQIRKLIRKIILKRATEGLVQQPFGSMAGEVVNGTFYYYQLWCSFRLTEF